MKAEDLEDMGLAGRQEREGLIAAVQAHLTANPPSTGGARTTYGKALGHDRFD